MKKIMNKTLVVLSVVTVMMLITVTGSFAMMSGGGGMMGGGSMMTTSGGFGMMDGMGGAPIVATDGTAFVTSMVPTATPGTIPTSGSFESHMMAVTTAGQTVKMSVSGLMSKPVVSGNYMISTVSLPNMKDYTIVADNGTTTQQSVAVWLHLPMTLSSTPLAIKMDGLYASAPVIKNNLVYITTSDFGYGMMQGNDVYSSTFPNMTFSSASMSYLYIFSTSGTLVSKTVLQ